jgi:hypothetical protein
MSFHRQEAVCKLPRGPFRVICAAQTHICLRSVLVAFSALVSQHC